MLPNAMRAGVERGELQIGTWVNMIRNPAILSASITNEAAEDLGLRVGAQAVAVIKATDVIVGTP